MGTNKIKVEGVTNQERVNQLIDVADKIGGLKITLQDQRTTVIVEGSLLKLQRLCVECMLPLDTV